MDMGASAEGTAGEFCTVCMVAQVLDSVQGSPIERNKASRESQQLLVDNLIKRDSN